MRKVRSKAVLRKLDKVVELITKLDFGCGTNVREGFEGVDILNFGQKHVLDVTQPWPWADESVYEANASHFIEHLKPQERIFFFNELYRVLKPGGTCFIIVPAWSSARAYGDLTHQWPPVSEYFFPYLNRDWRLGNKEKNIGPNAPHLDVTKNEQGFNCDFDFSQGYNMHPSLIDRNEAFQQDALTWKKEAAQDIIATLTKKVNKDASN